MNSLFKNRMSLLMVLVAFGLPVLLAKLVLDNHWYHGGVTNKGGLLEQGISYTSLGMSNPHPGRWQLIYMPPTSCTEACQDRLYILRQSHTALGKEQDRVTPVVMQAESAAAPLGHELPSAIPSAAMQSLLLSGDIIIVDPLGNLVMRYVMVTGMEAQLTQGKDLLADLRKMLKLSRIG
ncbi:hypothetical protein [Shewanella sp. GXUN23E]|uniref:hypothetical protein n=1 Tax=Shewanella sp. GXUN23E TaxID=3422498 RepID=UPI003D7D923C